MMVSAGTQPRTTEFAARMVADPDVASNHHGSAAGKSSMSRRLGGRALRVALVRTVVVIGNVNMAPHQHVVSNVNSLDTGDVNAVGEANSVAHNDSRMETLIAIPGDGLKPQSAVGVNISAELDVTRPSYQASFPQINAWSVKSDSKRTALELLQRACRCQP
jgi:hypothetical protein